MYVEIFKTDVIVFIGNVIIMCLMSHGTDYSLILTIISLNDQRKMSKLKISNDKFETICIKNIVFELNYARNKISILFI